MRLNLQRLQLVPACALVCLGLSAPAFADGGRDLTHVGQNITIGPGEQVGEATCFGCSIRVRGQVNGDVTAFGGSIDVEDQAQVNGDATVFGGSIRLEKTVKVSGDVTVFGGRIRRDPAATVGGDVTNMGGPGWIVLILGAPFVFLGLFVTLVIWLIRRLLRPSVPAAA